MQNVSARLPGNLIGEHRWAGDEHAARCADCGVSVWRRLTAAHEPGHLEWFQWHGPDGRDWSSLPGEGGWVTYPDGRAPSCPPQSVEARCPWEENARRYGHVWGDVQLATAMRTWCERHQMAVSECPEPGPVCLGAEGNCMWEGRCTGREDTCRCMCPVCCGDTPDMYGYDGG
ncbi:hypothetical protein IQ62_00120 [Streptomyces scabiei]|uniref:hypothetical protein n=1 Tax=Streptomyces scabiei TaxID=1930 RepID=UPI0004E6F919|nr:hypothetical protein [Streptomyces scabiei]KFG02756.1 hypothetical protein IQ62_00120 [Streptomyces scabiei]